MTTQVLVIEHESTCPPALFGTWLVDAGCAVEVCRPYVGDPLPAVGEIDGLVVLGGSMGATDEHPWLAPVRHLLLDAAVGDLPTLGICLGHQLCAVAFGGTVERNPVGQQLGLLDIGWTDPAAEDPLVGPLSTQRRGVQWNDDLVTRLPVDAVELAVTPRGENQAARFAPTVWGVQWHPEVDRAVLEVWASDDEDRHVAAGIDQERVLDEIGAARDELEKSWRPLAETFAKLAGSAR